MKVGEAETIIDNNHYGRVDMDSCVVRKCLVHKVLYAYTDGGVWMICASGRLWAGGIVKNEDCR